MKKIIEFLKSYLVLDTTSWLLFAIALILNAILWYIWAYKIHFNKMTMFYCFGVFIINTIFAFWIQKKDKLISNFLLGTALIIQIFVLVLIYNTI